MSSSDSPSPARHVSYVRLVTLNGKHVVLPTAAATHAKMLRDLLTGLALQVVHTQAQKDPTEPPTLEAELPVIHGDLREDLHSYATAYLMSSAESSVLASSAFETKGGAALLDIPLVSLEFATVARIAEALVTTATMKATCISRYHDVLKGLDHSSPDDQLEVIRLLLGADFLGC